MSNRIEEILDDMGSRCEHLMILSRVGVDDGEPTAAAGVLIVEMESGAVLAVEAGLDEDGRGSVTVRSWDGSFGVRAPVVLDLGESVMITT